jgi:hypothetical protein
MSSSPLAQAALANKRASSAAYFIDVLSQQWKWSSKYTGQAQSELSSL